MGKRLTNAWWKEWQGNEGGTRVSVTWQKVVMEESDESPKAMTMAEALP